MKKILVIEDTPSLREDVLQILECLDYEAIEAENGVAGVQLAQTYLPDLIICDVMMPELDGYGVFAALRQNPETATIPFIFLSAKADRSDIRQGMNLGADDYLTKPFTTSELRDAITARLEKQANLTQPYIDEMKKAAEHLSQLAYSDPLTNLPNRILLYHRLREALAAARRNQQFVAVVCLNLDRFKIVNNQLGHHMGDLLLQSVSQRLTRSVKHEDTVARLGGDEFSLILVNLSVIQDLEPILQRLLQNLTEPYSLNGHNVRIQPSMGVALYSNYESSPDQLLNQADTAMRWVKERGDIRYQFYSPEIDRLDTERQLIELHLGQALEREEFQIYYQPQVNLITGRIIGAEALLRWINPELGTVEPSKFIPIAEMTGLIVAIGEWVLRKACKQIKIWQTANLAPVRVAVNLSARQFQQQNLVAVIQEILATAEISPDFLCLELTETSVMEDVEATIATLHQLHQMGIQISIDDFGTGYSSLNYLKRFPLDTLKIDKSFINAITTDANDAAIAKAIIAMAQTLKLKVIAEGVETTEQFDFLRKHGCQAIQGYLISPPVPAAAFAQLLTQDRRL